MSRKFGEGHAAAMARLGLKELRNAANPSRESVADTEMGLYGTATQGEIAEARGSEGAAQESPEAALEGTPEVTLEPAPERTSVLGYPLPEPPRPEQERSPSHER